MTALHITLMGAPLIKYNDSILALERRKAVALVAYLSLADKPVSRDMLAAMLWQDYDDERARASLRRILAVVNKTPLGAWLLADRHTIQLQRGDGLWVDVHAFQTKLQMLKTSVDVAQLIRLYGDGFLAGFTLKDSIAFDDWQVLQAQKLQQALIEGLDQFASHEIGRGRFDEAVMTLRQWQRIDRLHERANYLLVYALHQLGKRAEAARAYDAYAGLLAAELGVVPGDDLQALMAGLRSEAHTLRADHDAPVLHLPAVPGLVIGRDDALAEVKARVGVNGDGMVQPTLVIQGWPGIGKTTLVSLLSHDNDVQQHFDGVLWTSLGEKPNLQGELTTWLKVLNPEAAETVETAEQARTAITSHILDRRLLLIVDDVWETSHAELFRVGGKNCTTIYTTRMNTVSKAIAPTADQIYKLPILSDKAAIDLLRSLAPKVVARYPDQSRDLVRSLEGLPLALQVAGRLLHSEYELGWGIHDLLADLRDGERLLHGQVPADRESLLDSTPPTVGVLLQRSTDRLDEERRRAFALLGVFAPKPATFDLGAIAAVWQTEDPRETIRVLVGRGLLEPVPGGRFQMHALLVLHAKSMFVH